jgi:hypothetical protein
MTGAGKSVIIADLLAQTGHRFGFRLIVEEGLSHAVLTQTQGCEPVIINLNGYKAIVKEPRWDKAILMILMGLAQGFELMATEWHRRAEVALASGCGKWTTIRVAKVKIGLERQVVVK